MKTIANRLRSLALAAPALTLALQASPPSPSDWPDPGPPSTRDLFPLNLIPLTYRPIGASTLGQGNSLVSLQITRANTFEFSELIKNLLTQDAQGRIAIDRAGTQAFAAAHASEPLLYFFDGEIQRTELRACYGVSRSTDLGLTLSWQSVGGGYLDGLIESVHKLGFEQAGRSNVVKDQLAIVVIQKGHVVLFVEGGARAHPEDPLITVKHRWHETADLTLSFQGALQVPLTNWDGAYKSNWDSSASLLFQWRPSRNQAVDGGVAYLRRSLRQQGPAPFFIKDQVAAHFGWEWRGWSRVRPYILLVGTGGITPPGPGTTLDKPSLIHDLGLHLRVTRRSALTFSYINNITHNENTADMGIALRLSVRP